MSATKRGGDMTRSAFCIGALALIACALPAPARADTCEDLWFSRNEVYKAQGYCFKTTRAIRAFGNAGCAYDALEEVPLSNAQRRMVADLAREERARGCPR